MKTILKARTLQGILFSTLLFSSRMSFGCAGDIPISGPASVCPNSTSQYSSQLASGAWCWDWSTVVWGIDGDAQFVDQNGVLLGKTITCGQGGAALGYICEPTAGSFVRVKAFSFGTFTLGARGECNIWPHASSSYSRQISVGLLPPDSISGPTTVGCSGTDVSLSSGNVANAVSYTWSVPNSTWLVNGTPGPNVTVTYSGPQNPPPDPWLSSRIIKVGSNVGNGIIGVRANSTGCVGNGFVYKNLTVTPGTLVISGPELICNTGTYTSTGSSGSVSWSSNNTAGLTINSSSGVATRVNNYSGPITITATLTNSCGSVGITKGILVGNPQVIPGNWPEVQCGSSEIYTIDPPPQGTSVQWGAWGALRIIGPTTGNHANVSSNGNQGEDGYVYVTETNACGQDTYNGPDYVPCQSYYLMVSPNPTSDELLVSFKANSDSSKLSHYYEIQLFNDKQERVFSVRNNEKVTRISTKNFQKGAYILHVNYNDNKKEKRIIIQ